MQPLWKITWQYLVRLNIGKLYDHLKKKKKKVVALFMTT